MPLTLDDLFATPDHYLHSFEGDAAVFMPMDRAAYHRSIFLDQRVSPAADQTMALPAPTLAPGVGKGQPTSWIFHMAHCGSTLLSRALDDPSASLVLREPFALRQTALAPDPARLNLVLAMLGKRYRADAPTLVKANVPVNFLLPDLVAAAPDMRAILLYLPLRPYLRAILRDEQHRMWLRNVTRQLTPYLGDLSALADGPRAAALWRAQIDAFATALASLPHARALDAEAFFASPLSVLRLAAAHLDLPLADATLVASVDGPLFSTYSKNPSVAFDNDARLARLAATEALVAPDIAAAEAWIAEQGWDQAPDAPLAVAALIR